MSWGERRVIGDEERISVLDGIALEDGDLVLIPNQFGETPRDAEEKAERQLTMLIVEDDDVDAEVLMRIVDRLPGSGWDIVRATSLAEVTELIGQVDPDVALVDLNLADAWHGDVVQSLIEQTPDCAVIVQTGMEDPKIPSEMLELGAQDFLQKGTITVDSLDRSIRHARIRHQTLGALRRTWNGLVRANAELDEFAHVVAHDLRAPARTARMLAGRLLAELPEDVTPLATELGDRLVDALGYMDDMILTMLDYAGLRDEIDAPSEVDVRRVLASALRNLDADLSEVGGTIAVQLPDTLGVWADSGLLQRVVHNLVGNSIKYRDPDRALEITIEADCAGPDVELRFRDNGIGIPASERERVFAVMQRLHHRRTEGLGFGLAICRRIVEAFDGEIWIEAVDGPGTVVVVRLPQVVMSGRLAA